MLFVYLVFFFLFSVVHFTILWTHWNLLFSVPHTVCINQLFGLQMENERSTPHKGRQCIFCGGWWYLCFLLNFPRWNLQLPLTSQKKVLARSNHWMMWCCAIDMAIDWIHWHTFPLLSFTLCQDLIIMLIISGSYHPQSQFTIEILIYSTNPTKNGYSASVADCVK